MKKMRKPKKATCLAIAQAINQLMPAEKYDDILLRDWMYTLLSSEEAAIHVLWGLLDQYIDAAILTMGCHFAKTTHHPETAFADQERIYRLIVSRTGVHAGSLLRREGFLEKEKECKEMQALLKEWTQWQQKRGVS